MHSGQTLDGPGDTESAHHRPDEVVYDVAAAGVAAAVAEPALGGVTHHQGGRVADPAVAAALPDTRCIVLLFSVYKLQFKNLCRNVEVEVTCFPGSGSRPCRRPPRARPPRPRTAAPCPPARPAPAPPRYSRGW